MGTDSKLVTRRRMFLGGLAGLAGYELLPKSKAQAAITDQLPYCWLQHSVAVDIPSSNTAWTTLPWDLDREDPFDMHNPAVNNDRVYLVQQNSIVTFTVTVKFEAASSGRRGVRLWQPPGFVVAEMMVPGVNAEQAVQCTVQAGGDPGLGSYVKVQAFQNSGVTLKSIVDGINAPSLMAVYETKRS